MRSRKTIITTVLFVLAISMAASGASNDWPMWRHDANRSAATGLVLPEELNCQWVRELPALETCWEDPVNADRMPFDRAYEPVVEGSTMYIVSNRSDCVVALDTRTGKEKWRTYTDGPVRLPAAIEEGKVYGTSDDGRLYCIDGENGEILWQFQGGPDNRKVLGNSRMISAWPARGGAVIKDGTVYFAAGIWPLMGVFIYAVDAATGEMIWSNDGLSMEFLTHPHNADAFGGIAPQGALVVSGEKLLVPGGRTQPACIDRKTGELLYFNLLGSKHVGGSHVSASSDIFLDHRGLFTKAYDLGSGKERASWGRETYPVFAEDVLYMSGNPIESFDLTSKQEKGFRRSWEYKGDGSGALIKAGNKLYAGSRNKVFALQLNGNRPPTACWEHEVKGTVARLVAADDRLFAVTLEGSIYAFGRERSEPKRYEYETSKQEGSQAVAEQVEKIMGRASVAKGYCLVYGLDSGDLACEIARRSDLFVVAVDSNENRVDELRRKFDVAGMYGKQVSVHKGTPATFGAPPYVAAVIVFETLADCGFDDTRVFIQSVFRSMRPYGGIAYLPVKEDAKREELKKLASEMQLAGLKLETDGDYLVMVREGALPGAAPWTHLYGDMANTAKSDDKLVKLPLGILWFGGNTHMDVLPRHGHGPTEQILGGRLFIEGINMLSARDVYTGKVLWKREFDDLGTFGAYYDSSYKPDPFDLSYNQNHMAGANSRGTNYVVESDAIYLLMKDECLVLSPATGATEKTFKLPSADGESAPVWGYIGVYEDYLIATSSPIDVPLKETEKTAVLDAEAQAYPEETELSSITSVPGVQLNTPSASASRTVVVMDRHSGKVLWRRDAAQNFRHNAIVAGNGRLYCMDKVSQMRASYLGRRGLAISEGPALYCLDIGTGEVKWRNTENVFGTWLGYSEEHDLLVQGGRDSRDTVADEESASVAVFRGDTGDVVWNKKLGHSGPLIIHGETVYMNTRGNAQGAFSLLSGESKMIEHPLTEQSVPWQYERHYGCGSVIGSEHLLTFRSGAAGFTDPAGSGGTGNFGGFRSSCTSNLIAADGVLNAPDYTRTCGCSYQNQTSLALIHMPDVEVWTFNNVVKLANDTRVLKAGLNFGAPGDRTADNGTLWLDIPSGRSPSPELKVEIAPGLKPFRRHSSFFRAGGGHAWVGASGLEGSGKITITLGGKELEKSEYTVSLFFAEPEKERAGERVFDVSLQKRTVLASFDIVAEAAPKTCIKKTFSGIEAGAELTIELLSRKNAALISGIEIIAEDHP